VIKNGRRGEPSHRFGGGRGGIGGVLSLARTLWGTAQGVNALFSFG